MRQREMIDSGLQHITDVPKKWKRTYYKYEIDILNGFPFKSELFDKIDGFPLIRIRDITSGKIETYYKGEFEDEYIVVKGDLLVGMDGDFNSRLWDNEDALLNQRCCKIVANEETTHLAFIKYLLPIYLDVINDLTYYTTVKHLSVNDIYNSLLFLPKYDEQTKIANYLDHKTGIIDQLIADKERLVALLQEQRQATINEAVTGGLDEDGNIRQKPESLPAKGWKDSGIEWLGAVPEDWEVVKLKYISDITRGAILRPVDEPSYFDDNGKWTYLNISDATACEKYLHSGKLKLSDLGSTKSARVEADNLIMTASATIGKMFINRIPVCVHDGFIPIRNIKCNMDYLYHYLGNKQLYKGIGKINTQKNIYLDEVKNMDITIPSKREQQNIVKFLENTEKSFLKLNSMLESQIQNLRSYRQSLISEAVTGKIDLREWKEVE